MSDISDIEARGIDDNENVRERAMRRLREVKEEGILVDLFDDFDSDAAEPPEEEGVYSIEQAMELLADLAELNADERKGAKPNGKWARMGGNYTLVGDTVDEMPAGYYDTDVQNGQLFFVPVSRRYDKILRFPHANTERVLQGIEKFWTREAIFREFKLPYKRGILMYGPPGSGKTSALQLIARDVVQRGGIVLLFDQDTFLHAYRQIRRVQPDTPVVVLMEDLDAILERRESTVLNMLDGAEAMHKVVFLATTNYPENLGERIINRPSRFDMRVFVDHPDEVGRRMYFESLLEGHDTEIDIDRYVRDTRGMSLAHLKELFVATVVLGDEYKSALSHLKEMYSEKPHSANDDRNFRPEVGGGVYV